jgi:hypothetical protein
MKIIVIADIHNNTRWIEPTLEQLKKDHNWDKAVFLGDYFDHYGDNEFSAEGTAKWLKQSISQDDRIHLLGNHDMPYLTPYCKFVWCPGFTAEKRFKIRSVLTEEDCKKIRPACTFDDWVFSHAGFTQSLMNYIAHPVHGYPDSPEALVKRAESELDRLRIGDESPFFQCGARMGEATPGGITWADWNMEFIPIKGINQIVGHTPHKKPTPRHIEGSFNYVLDTGCRHVGLLQDGKPEWIRTTVL